MRNVDPTMCIRNLSRREFIKASGGCAAMTSTALVSTLLNLQMTKSVMAAGLPHPGGYKALVCVFLYGGNDASNLLVPNEGNVTSGEFADYATKRGGVYDATTNPSGIALPQLGLLDITNTAGRHFGIHPGMPEIQTLYNAGKAAFIANVGTLIEPTTKSDYDAGINLPKGLFSHADEQRSWQTALPHTRSQLKGWAGRIADLLTDSTNSNDTIAMSIALNSVNIIQTGDVVFPYVIGETGATQLTYYNESSSTERRLITSTTDSILAQTYSDLLEKTYANNRRDAIDAAIEFNNLTSGVTLNTTFPNTSLGRQASMVAKTITVRAQLGQDRQIFFISLGGFDHHDEVITNQANLLPQVSQAIKALYDEMVALNLADQVTIFTASDFSRTLSSNGNGSDHGWGANHFVVGDAINSNVWGDYPTSLLNPVDGGGLTIDTGRGRLIPTTSVDEYAAELAMWFGIPNDSNLETILPNIRNFYTSGSPIGFMIS